MTKKQLTVVFGASMLLVGLSLSSATAQPPRMGRGGGDGGHEGRGPEALFEVLQLSDAQREEWTLLHADQREASRALMNEMRTLRSLIKQELESGAPDATTVGEAMISVHDLETEMRALVEQLREDTAAILDDEQLASLEAFMASHKGGRRGFGGRKHRGRHGGGEES